MTPQQEQTLLQALYDRLFDAVTYVPSTGAAVFDPATTLVQFTKNEAINPADFSGMVSPNNPITNGPANKANLGASEQFARMVDTIPAVQADYVPKAGSLSSAYGIVVQNANTTLQPNLEQETINKKAFAFLNVTTTGTDFLGNPTTTISPSPIYLAYKSNQAAYVQAVSNYRLAYNGYNLTIPAQQAQWQAVEPVLANAVQQAYTTWRSEGAAQVEQAVNALASSANNAVSAAISGAQTAFANAGMASQLGIVNKWYMTYALPTNWCDPAASSSFSQLSLSSSNLNTSANSNFSAYQGGASWSAGLWSVGASAGGSNSSQNYHMDAQNISLSAKIGLVRITRPWYYDFLFSMNGWSLTGVPQNGISNGQLKGNTGMIPLVPTAFIVATDITITGDFSTQDQSIVQSALSTSANVGWGPFSIGGSYSHSSSNQTFKSTFDNGSLMVPGLQIIAWVSEIVHASPPLAAS